MTRRNGECSCLINKIRTIINNDACVNNYGVIVNYWLQYWIGHHLPSTGSASKINWSWYCAGVMMAKSILKIFIFPSVLLDKKIPWSIFQTQAPRASVPTYLRYLIYVFCIIALESFPALDGRIPIYDHVFPTLDGRNDHVFLGILFLYISCAQRRIVLGISFSQLDRQLFPRMP